MPRRGLLSLFRSKYYLDYRTVNLKKNFKMGPTEEVTGEQADFGYCVD